MLENYEPKKVLQYFEEMTTIPHCSGNEATYSNYLVNFAKEHGLEVHQDDHYNVIIKKPGTKGKEDLAPVIIQGHMDMVCVKEDDLEFDFDTMALPIYVDGDFLKSKGTTLGGDNGIAVAMALAILDSDELEHPPLEVLITTEEEVGLLGAAALQGEHLQGETLINLDSEEEGVFLASCCGGVRNFIDIPVEYQDNPHKHSYKLRIFGLKGGHSGMEINTHRASANKLLARVLLQLEVEVGYLEGGEKMNSIAKQAIAHVSSASDLTEHLQELEETFKKEYAGTDDAIEISVEALDSLEKVFTEESKKRVLAALQVVPQGVQAMSQHMEGLVETSSNFGVLSTTEEAVRIESSHRSSVESKKQDLVKLFEAIATLSGGKTHTQGDYPGWEFVPESAIRDLFVEVYEELSGEQAKVEAIHAGLECGVIQDCIGRDLDMVSLGPNMAEVHTPNERLSLSSVKRTYDLVVEVLRRIR